MYNETRGLVDSTVRHLSAIWHRFFAALRLAPLMAIVGCVSLHTPLTSDKGYPANWASIIRLGPRCKGINGDYDNAGTLAATALSNEPVLLTNVLGLAEPATRLSLAVITRNIDKNGDSQSMLEILPDGNTAARRTLEECFCIEETLMCKVTESYRGVPYISIGGSQRNVYFSLAQDGALIAKLQDYHIDVVLVAPVFGKAEPWARFPRFER
jgi:hypothetical protein